MELRKMRRFQAFAGHLSISFCVAVVSAIIVFFLWYPDMLAKASGVGSIFFVLLGVDVCLGPLITLIVFNTQKKELERDLIIVGILQILALLYGLHAVFVARPVYIVYNAGRFDIVRANDLSDEVFAKAKLSDNESMSYWSPRWIAAKFPDDQSAKDKLLFDSISGGADLPQSPQYYVSYLTQRESIRQKCQNMNELMKFNPDKHIEIKILLQKYNDRHLKICFLPLRGKVADLSVILNKETAEVLEQTDLLPWK